MIMVHCVAQTAPEKQAEFIRRVNEAGIIEKTNEEAGCISYELSSSAGVPGKMYIIERWESQKAMMKHARAPHYIELGKLREEYGVSIDYTMYKAEPLG